ncbi:MAG: hypothetical protein J6W96_06285 [Alphaproteobacteria bacterium]|nr:hypothetical protein [Alphaproteobacteria bacterium]
MQKIIRIDDANPQYLTALKADCYVLYCALNDDFCRDFIEQGIKKDKIVLFYGEDAVERCVSLKADGVIVDLGADNLEEKVQLLRQTLGQGKYIGLVTRNRKHESMLVSEAEPDFVVFKVWKDGFDKVKELTDWYNEFFLIQSAAWIIDDDIAVGELNTDFVIQA